MSIQQRKSGILLPVFSLPSDYGIGTFGKEAYRFVDFLKKAGQSYWQILPLGPTGYGDSPYQSFSTFAGNPYFIDLDLLMEEGLITSNDIHTCISLNNTKTIDYEQLFRERFTILKRAFRKFNQDTSEFVGFVLRNEEWLLDYALFMAMKDANGGKAFVEWEADIRVRDIKALCDYSKKYSNEIHFYCFLQFQFYKQWKNLKAYANGKGIKIIGDLPIYVAFDSADVWANPELFQMDEEYNPIAVAGCPPDMFSKTGQLWGNPLYTWDYHKATKYEWWKKRMENSLNLYDIVRIDHFRGFDEYYSIPYPAETAEYGTWEKGPGYEIFESMKEIIGKNRIIAEDLGFLTDSVKKLVKKTGYPGMKILHFAFSTDEESLYLPHNFDKNSVVYTGTHDNDTSIGFWNTCKRKEKKFMKDYLHFSNGKNIHEELIRACFSSVANTCIIPLQDYLGLGSEARINVPSTLGVNWLWRIDKSMMTDEVCEKIYVLTKLYFRL